MSGNQKIEIFYNNGVEFVKVATYEFSVARPWYFSIGMLLVYFLFISILLYLYYKWNKIRYTEKLKLKEEELKHQKEIIQIELEAENKLKLQEYEKHMLEMQIQSKASEVAGKSLSIAKQSEMIESIQKILDTETDLVQLKNKVNKIVFVCFILLIMAFTPDMRLAVILGPIWMVALAILYVVKYRSKVAILPEVQSSP